MAIVVSDDNLKALEFLWTLVDQSWEKKLLTSTKSLPGLNHSYQYFPHINNKNTGPFQIYVIYIYIKKCSYKANICSLAHNLNTVGADFCFLAITIAMRIGFFVGLAFGGLGWRWRIGWDGGGCIGCIGWSSGRLGGGVCGGWGPLILLQLDRLLVLLHFLRRVLPGVVLAWAPTQRIVLIVI